MDEPTVAQELSAVAVLPGRRPPASGVAGHSAALAGVRRELPNLTVLDLFEQRAAGDPEAIAVVSHGRFLTYRELAAAACRVEGDLSARGIGRGRVVAVATSRSAAALVGMLAVWRAGAVYLPIDPAYPAERIALLLGDARVAAVVTERRCAAAIPADTAPVIAVDQLLAPDPPAAPTRRSAAAEDAAYV